MINQTISIDNLPDLLTVREVAQILRVSPLTIKRWGKRGKLPAIRINSRGDRRYKKEAVLWLLGIQPKALHPRAADAASKLVIDDVQSVIL